MHRKIRSFIAKLLVKVRHRFGIGSASVRPLRSWFDIGSPKPTKWRFGRSLILTKTAIAFWRLCVEFGEVGNSNFAVEHLEFDFQAVLILEMSSTDVVAVEEFINSSLFSKSFFCLKNFNFCQNFGNLNFGAKIWTLQIGEIQNPTF